MTIPKFSKNGVENDVDNPIYLGSLLNVKINPETNRNLVVRFRFLFSQLETNDLGLVASRERRCLYVRSYSSIRCSSSVLIDPLGQCRRFFAETYRRHRGLFSWLARRSFGSQIGLAHCQNNKTRSRS